jgi:hypothetical protein
LERLEELMDGAESFDDMFIKLWKKLNQQQVVTFSMLAWSFRKNWNL